jgi:malonyl-CoA O-methyltransferase
MSETLEAYRRWAPMYSPIADNPLMRAEQTAMQQCWPEVQGSRVLDLACGKGRYSRMLLQSGAAEVVALDFCLPMLMQATGNKRVCASMMHLPFAANCFDAVISGLAIGHAADVFGWMAEMARVLRPGGALLYSDFHPDAARAGLVRSFKDSDNETRSVPHADYSVATQIEAARSAGLRIEVLQEVRVGIELRERFDNCEEFYRACDGLPIVLIVKARK